MRPVRRSPSFLLAVGALAVALVACSPTTPTSGAGTTALPTDSGPATTASLAPSSSAEALASTGSSAAATPSAAVAASNPPATPSPTPAPTTRPTAKPTPAPTPTGYQCSALLTNAEVRQATGLRDATLVGGHNGTPQTNGQTYCPYRADSVNATVAIAVWAKPAASAFAALWDRTATYSQQAPGIGRQAIVDAGDGVGLALVGKLGVSVQIVSPAGVPAGVDAWTVCQALLKKVVGRV